MPRNEIREESRTPVPCYHIKRCWKTPVPEMTIPAKEPTHAALGCSSQSLLYTLAMANPSARAQSFPKEYSSTIQTGYKYLLARPSPVRYPKRWPRSASWWKIDDLKHKRLHPFRLAPMKLLNSGTITRNAARPYNERWKWCDCRIVKEEL